MCCSHFMKHPHSTVHNTQLPMSYVIYLLTSPPLRAPSVLGRIISSCPLKTIETLSLGFFTRPPAPLRTARSCFCLSAKRLFQRLTTVTYFVDNLPAPPKPFLQCLLFVDNFRPMTKKGSSEGFEDRTKLLLALLKKNFWPPTPHVAAALYSLQSL